MHLINTVAHLIFRLVELLAPLNPEAAADLDAIICEWALRWLDGQESSRGSRLN